MWDSEPWLQLHLLALRKNGLHNKSSKWGGFPSMWDSEPWLQLHLLALRKNGLHNKRESFSDTLLP